MKIQKDKMNSKNIKIVAISLPANLLKKADEKAATLYQSRSEYIRRLIFLDLNLASLANSRKAK